MKTKMTLSKKGMWMSILIFFVFTYIGKYIAEGHVAEILLLPVVCLLIFYLIGNKFKIEIKISFFHIWMFLFCVFSFMSGLWAVRSTLAFSTGFNLLELFVIMLLITHILQQNFSLKDILALLMFIGYTIDIYVLLYYGLGSVINMLLRNQRVTNDAINANLLGITTAYSVIVNLYYVLYRKKRLWSVFLLLASLILIISGSRTALFGVAFGIVLMFFFKSLSDRKKENRIIKIVLVLFILMAFFCLVYNLPVFIRIKVKMQSLLKGIMGVGGEDSSTSVRLAMIGIGIETFFQHPFGGVGINNAQVIYGMSSGVEMYLHNNYIEILADGGIIGFGLYYSMIIYLLYQYLTHQDFSNGEYTVCFVVLLVMLLIDIGSVSYIDRGTYLLLFLLYWNIKSMKQRKYLLKLVKSD